MRIASSKDENCIKRLMYVLERTHPGISFQLHISRLSTIDVPDDEIELWEDMNKNIFKDLIKFCNGYTIGWEDAIEVKT